MPDNNDHLHPFSSLTPDYVLDAIESLGYCCDGRMLALNSYENRVYQIGLDEAEPIIVKFYRPGRWTLAQIQEEHDFVFELAEQELSVVCPLRNKQGQSLQHVEQFPIAVYPRRGGRAPELDNMDHLYTMGQVLAQMHNVGASNPFEHRPTLTIDNFGVESRDLIATMIPAELKAAYLSVSEALLDMIRQRFQGCDRLQFLRTHGDCHTGNVLWRDVKPHFVDFDDARMAPAIQDVWMLLSGDRLQQQQQMTEILEGYEMFRDFPLSELSLIESLRTLRMMHHSAWLARRWEDPAFPMHFPWFNTDRYWGEHILQLREQQSLLQEPPLQLLTTY